MNFYKKRDFAFRVVIRLIFHSIWIVGFILCQITDSRATNMKRGNSPKSDFFVKDYGAKGDGKSLDTKEIQAAIDDASSHGGGTVILSPGIYLSGTIVLKDFITLRVDAGATLLGSIDMKDYPEHIGLIDMIPGVKFSAPLIYAENANYVGVAGKGVIDGQGTRVNFAPLPASSYRPGLVRFNKCRYVTLEDIHLKRPARWTLHLRDSQDITVRNIFINSRSNRNNDGIDIDGSQRVKITGCTIDTEDDAIVLKSYRPHTVSDIVVSDCILSSYCYAFKIGTETLGDFENVSVTNCLMSESHGIALQTVDGANVSNINISNITMNNCFSVLEMRLGGRLRSYSENKDAIALKPGSLKNITITNIQADQVANNYDYICGIPGYAIENVTLDNIRINYKGGVDKAETSRKIPEQITAYPKWTSFGTLPSYGFYVRHVKGIRMNNIQLSIEKPDQRSALFVDKVSDLIISSSSFTGETAGSPVISLNDTSNALVQNCAGGNETGTLIGIEGSASKGILLDGNDFSKAQKYYSKGEGVSEPMVR